MKVLEAVASVSTIWGTVFVIKKKSINTLKTHCTYLRKIQDDVETRRLKNTFN